MSKAIKAIEKLAKWRTVFTGWQLGTRTDTDPEARAVRDHREATMIMRAELNAVAGLLIDKGIITPEEFDEALAKSADELSEQYQKKFPGFKATEYGMEINAAIARDTTQGWKP